MVKKVIDWDQIETAFLDMDGTLMDLAFDNYFWHEYVPKKYCEAQGLEYVQAKELLIEMYKSRRGTLSWYCTDYWTDKLELNIAALKREVAPKVSLFPLANEFLLWLRGQKKRTVLLTNAHMDSVDVKLEETGIRSKFDRIISSHQYGHAKEAEQFWPKLAEDEAHIPSRTLLIDDNVAVLHAARRYGIKYLLSINQPDTTQPRQDTGGFVAIDGFAEIVADLARS